MRVTVEYFGPARDAVGVGRENIECDAPCSAQELVEQIARDKSGRIAALLLTNGHVSRSLLLAVNDRQVFLTEPVVLSDGDVVSIIPPVSGGACSGSPSPLRGGD